MEAIANIQDQVSPEEWQVRCDLAAVYRLVAMHGWDDLLFTHISARVPNEGHSFLINPFGMMFEEVTASSLVKVDENGNKLMDSPYDINPAGFTIHSAVHTAREDAGCVLHLHTDDGVAVTCMQEGLMPISQHAMQCLDQVAYHDYEGIALDLDERERIVNDLGDKKLLLLRNHGTLTVGIDCKSAWLQIYYLERACTMQVKALSSKQGVVPVNQGVPDVVTKQSEVVFNGMLGELTWPAMLRRLERAGEQYAV
ncbi:MAG: class II aldolase/adducin family protein [Pseudomonadaceae bacterium]|nr:class II aldolase/adducin family protein [Pseudomonadaceae bacterium]